MALDHALAERFGAGSAGGEAPGDDVRPAILRLYGWESPTVSFGRHEPAREKYGPGAAVAAAVTAAVTAAGTQAGSTGGSAFVRRPTGGRAVFHREELTYAVVLPDRAFGGPRGAYLAVNEALVAGLRLLGVDVTLAREGAALGPAAGPCFDVPAAGEVTAAGGKLVGSAQARLGRALLQHGAILLADDQATLGSRSAARPLRSLLARVTVAEVVEAVEEGFRLRFAGANWVPSVHDSLTLAAADRLEAERYGSDAWTWRH